MIYFILVAILLIILIELRFEPRIKFLNNYDNFVILLLYNSKEENKYIQVVKPLFFIYWKHKGY